MNASTPPPAHARRNQGASGMAAATAGERKRMPPPMTLATMMAAASSGPSRRSRTWGVSVVVVGTGGFYHNSQRPTPNLQNFGPSCLGVGNWKLVVDPYSVSSFRSIGNKTSDLRVWELGIGSWSLTPTLSAASARSGTKLRDLRVWELGIGSWSLTPTLSAASARSGTKLRTFVFGSWELEVGR